MSLFTGSIPYGIVSLEYLKKVDFVDTYLSGQALFVYFDQMDVITFSKIVFLKKNRTYPTYFRLQFGERVIHDVSLWNLGI